MKIANNKIESFLNRVDQEKIAGCLVYGPESSLVDYRANLIAKKITPDLSDPFLVANISKERIGENKGILLDEFFSFSMLGGRKLILVKSSDASAAAALKLLFEDQNFAKKSDNFILIQAGDLDKASPLRKAAEENPHFAAVACYEDDERTIKSFIASQMSAQQIKTDAQTISLMLEKFGKNRQIILSEIEKISTFLGEKKQLKSEDLEMLTASESEASSNDFIMNFCSQKFGESLAQLEKLFRDGFEPIMLIRFLSNYLQKLYFCKVEIELNKADFEEVVKSQRLFFRTEIEFRKHLRVLSLQFLTKTLQDLEVLEVKLKNNSMSPKLAVLDFVQYFLRK